MTNRRQFGLSHASSEAGHRLGLAAGLRLRLTRELSFGRGPTPVASASATGGELPILSTNVHV